MTQAELLDEPERRLIPFLVDDNDDPEITCIACGGQDCDLSVEVLGMGKLVWCGFHQKCLEWHIARVERDPEIHRAWKPSDKPAGLQRKYDELREAVRADLRRRGSWDQTLIRLAGGR